MKKIMIMLLMLLVASPVMADSTNYFLGFKIKTFEVCHEEDGILEFEQGNRKVVLFKLAYDYLMNDDENVNIYIMASSKINCKSLMIDAELEDSPWTCKVVKSYQHYNRELKK